MMTDWSLRSIVLGWLVPTGLLVLAAWIVVTAASRYWNK